MRPSQRRKKFEALEETAVCRSKVSPESAETLVRAVESIEDDATREALAEVVSILVGYEPNVSDE